MLPLTRLLAAAAVVAVRLAAAQFDAGQAVIDDCRARLPANTVFNVLNGAFGVTGVQSLNSTAPGLLAPISSEGTLAGACAGYSLNALPKHVSGGAGAVALPRCRYPVLRSAVRTTYSLHSMS